MDDCFQLIRLALVFTSDCRLALVSNPWDLTPSLLVCHNLKYTNRDCTKLTLPPKAGDKWGSSQLDSSDTSDSSGKDLDAKGGMGSKKVLTLTKMVPNPSQWTADGIDFVHQYQYKMDVECFQKYDNQHEEP